MMSFKRSFGNGNGFYFRMPCIIMYHTGQLVKLPNLIWCTATYSWRLLHIPFFFVNCGLMVYLFRLFFLILLLVQHSDDTCLAYTLAAICNLLSEVGISCTSGILGKSYSPGTHIGTSLSIQQQLLVLLRRSLKRAESLNLKRLVASSHLSMAKFYLTVRI